MPDTSSPLSGSVPAEPVAPANPVPPVTAAAQPPAVQVNAAPKKRILLMEDEADLREFYSDFLSADFIIETAKDGEEGLNKLKNSSFDLVLLDIMMPKVDGLSVLKQKNQDPKIAGIPVVILSNLGHEDVLKSSFDLGVKYYILKAETSPEQILPILQKALTSDTPKLPV